MLYIGPQVRNSGMITLRLTGIELDDLAEALDDPELPERTKLKLLVIRMHHEGAGNGFIAKVLRLSLNTPVSYLKQYQSGGLCALVEDRYYRPSSSLEPFMACLRCSFQAVPAPNAKEAMARIEALTGMKLSESQVRRTMRGMGMVWRKAAPLPGKADPQLQFDFYTNEMLPRLTEAAEGSRKVFFVDAAHFVLGSFLGMVWCFSRVFIRTSPGRQRYNVLGAVESHGTSLVTIRSTDNVTAQTVCALLRKVRQRNPGIPITIVLDNVRYHRSREVVALAGDLDIELLYLPAYSPNLNLIERLWKLVKKQCLVNIFYPDFAGFRAAIDDCIDHLAKGGRKLLHSLLTPNFQFFQFHES
jgi:transposase